MRETLRCAFVAGWHRKVRWKSPSCRGLTVRKRFSGVRVERRLQRKMVVGGVVIIAEAIVGY